MSKKILPAHYLHALVPLLQTTDGIWTLPDVLLHSLLCLDLLQPRKKKKSSKYK